MIGFAESDFNNEAEQVMEDGVHKTYGIFQMSDKFFGTREQILDLEYSTRNRLAALRSIGPLNPGSLVRQCWKIQRWIPWQDSVSFDEWLKSSETQNYINRESRLSAVIVDRNYFKNGRT